VTLASSQAARVDRVQRGLARILLEVDQSLPAAEYTQAEVRLVVDALDLERKKAPPHVARSFSFIRNETRRMSTEHFYSLGEMMNVFEHFTGGGDFRTIDKIREALDHEPGAFRPDEMRMVLMALDQAKSLWPEAPRSISQIMEECKEHRPVQTRFYSREEMTAVLKFYRAFDGKYTSAESIRGALFKGVACFGHEEVAGIFREWDLKLLQFDEIRTRQWDMDTIIEHLEGYDGYYSASEMRLMAKDWMAGNKLRAWETDGECVMEEAREGNDRFYSLQEVRNLCDYYEARSRIPLMLRTPKTTLAEIIEFHNRPCGKGMYFESEVAILLQEIKTRDHKLYIICTALK